MEPFEGVLWPPKASFRHRLCSNNFISISTLLVFNLEVALTVRYEALQRIGEREIEKHELQERRIKQSNFPKRAKVRNILHTLKSTLDQVHTRKHHQRPGFEGRERSNHPSTFNTLFCQ